MISLSLLISGKRSIIVSWWTRCLWFEVVIENVLGTILWTLDLSSLISIKRGGLSLLLFFTLLITCGNRCWLLDIKVGPLFEVSFLRSECFFQLLVSVEVVSLIYLAEGQGQPGLWGRLSAIHPVQIRIMLWGDFLKMLPLDHLFKIRLVQSLLVVQSSEGGLMILRSRKIYIKVWVCKGVILMDPNLFSFGSHLRGSALSILSSHKTLTYLTFLGVFFWNILT